MSDDGSSRRGCLTAGIDIPRVMLATGSAAIGIAGFLGDAFLPALRSLGPTTIPAELLLVVAAAAALIWPGVWTRRALGLWWLIAALVAAVHAMIGAASLTAWVPAIEYLLIGIAVIARFTGRGDLPTRVLVVAAAGALAWFGIVHLTHAADIASLMPSWIPVPGKIPFLTGAIMLAAAVAYFTKWRRAAAFGIAAMFVSWLPLVHAARLLATPHDAGEWIFALTAWCLAGAMLAVAAVSDLDGWRKAE